MRHFNNGNSYRNKGKNKVKVLKSIHELKNIHSRGTDKQRAPCSGAKWETQGRNFVQGREEVVNC